MGLACTVILALLYVLTLCVKALMAGARKPFSNTFGGVFHVRYAWIQRSAHGLDTATTGKPPTTNTHTHKTRYCNQKRYRIICCLSHVYTHFSHNLYAFLSTLSYCVRGHAHIIGQVITKNVSIKLSSAGQIYDCPQSDV